MVKRKQQYRKADAQFLRSRKYGGSQDQRRMAAPTFNVHDATLEVFLIQP
jgi:hypothetical protein